MATKNSQKKWAWLTKTQAAEVVGYSVRHFGERIQPLIEKQHWTGRGAKLRFMIHGVTKAAVDYATAQQKQPAEGIDPLLAGDDSDALDEYRREATTEKRLKNAVTRGELIDREKTADAIRAGITAMRETGDRLVRRFGNEAGDLFNDAVGEFEGVATRVIADAS